MRAWSMCVRTCKAAGGLLQLLPWVLAVVASRFGKGGQS